MRTPNPFRQNRAERGLTLLEVLLAVAVTSILTLSVSGLLGSALQANRQTGQTHDLTRVAEAELGRQRQSVHTALMAQTGLGCSGAVPSALSCTVERYPCSFSAQTLTCTTGNLAASDLAAHQIVVTVGASSGAPFRLQTVVAQ